MTYEVARNERTTLYEVHKAGCKHLIAKHMIRCGDATGETAAQAAADYEAENDGIITTLGACVRKER